MRRDAPLENASEVLAKNFENASALLIGPGFGTEATTKVFLENLLAGRSAQKKAAARIGFVHTESERKVETENAIPPLVIDADGLKLLAQIKDWASKLPPLAILTPHPGEMSVLTGLSKEEIQENRQAVASKYAQEWGHVVVLKGAFTLIAAPDGRVTMIPVASPALARAGTGDVLAGLIVGLRAQWLGRLRSSRRRRLDPRPGGLYAADDLGTAASVLASDVLNSV
ncbi:MAG: NAD(P)H-hydrate dehydratase [Candidatus Moduliflexus flocculans]|nr:NAD(P)H-hydrate dehydratase [Candidatus Moduliflexus flocculans]